MLGVFDMKVNHGLGENAVTTQHMLGKVTHPKKSNC